QTLPHGENRSGHLTGLLISSYLGAGAIAYGAVQYAYWSAIPPWAALLLALVLAASVGMLLAGRLERGLQIITITLQQINAGYPPVPLWTGGSWPLTHLFTVLDLIA